MRTPGVIEVFDRLIYNELLMDQVKELLDARGYGDLDVRYENGLIELHGTVPNSATIHTLRDLVLRVTGVRGVVVNQLTVAPPEAAAPAQEPAAPQVNSAAEAKSATVGAAEGKPATAPANGAGQPKVSETRRG